jgi:hypothetical protein
MSFIKPMLASDIEIMIKEEGYTETTKEILGKRKRKFEVRLLV